MAMEAFHKASLVHDDIQDNDPYRYGQETLHRRYGVGAAINVGDYLIGLGYRLISQSRKVLGADVASDILDRLASAHLRLCEGQGAELRWTGPDAVKLTALDAMKLYALKTSPAFEAALYAGLRSRPAGPMVTSTKRWSRRSAVILASWRFQILKIDLLDWEEHATWRTRCCRRTRRRTGQAHAAAGRHGARIGKRVRKVAKNLEPPIH